MKEIIILMLIGIILALIIEALINVWCGYTIEREQTGYKTIGDRLFEYGKALYKRTHSEDDK